MPPHPASRTSTCCASGFGRKTRPSTPLPFPLPVGGKALQQPPRRPPRLGHPTGRNVGFSCHANLDVAGLAQIDHMRREVIARSHASSRRAIPSWMRLNSGRMMLGHAKTSKTRRTTTLHQVFLMALPVSTQPITPSKDTRTSCPIHSFTGHIGMSSRTSLPLHS